MQTPDASEYAPYYHRYVSLVPAGQCLALMHEQVGQMEALLSSVTDAQGMHAYAPGKWTLKEVIGHVADAERVFGYRALHLARGDANPLPSYEQDLWSPNGAFNALSVASVLGQWKTARLSNIAVAEGLPEEAHVRSGTVSGNPCTVRALVHMLPGHVAYHIAHMRQHYLA
ncbi:MAG: DinB family protein [Cytophagaceae bacterium]|nr:DinB family protein [Gemmatimonadaceae bacterium]